MGIGISLPEQVCNEGEMSYHGCVRDRNVKPEERGKR
jgi:hypothetical protein